MGIGTALIGFFSALPEILKLIQSVMTWINQVSGNDPQSYIKTVGLAFDKLGSAKTEQERQDAAKDIAKLISGLK